MRIYLVPNTTRPRAAGVACAAAELLRAEGAEVLASFEAADMLAGCEGIEYASQPDAWQACDLVLTVGGDGTILHAARHAKEYQKPLVGVNTGRLGFLTIVESDELYKLQRLTRGEYSVEQRELLEVRWEEDGQAHSTFALNDILLFKTKPESTIDLDILCDDIQVSSIRGDGVVFATPTGSTAYSMSAGGPILDARLGGVVVTQICAHILQMPPMVFSTGRVLRAIQPKGQVLCLTADGLPSTRVQAETVTVCRAAHTVPLVQFADSDQLKSIDKKLKGR